MQHALRIDFLDRPHIGGIFGTKKGVRRPLAPTIKTPFVIAHVILSGQNRMLFDPNNRLREMEVSRLEHRRIVAAVAIATPYVKGSSWLQHPCDVPKPGLKAL